MLEIFSLCTFNYPKAPQTFEYTSTESYEPFPCERELQIVPRIWS